MALGRSRPLRALLGVMGSPRRERAQRPVTVAALIRSADQYNTRKLLAAPGGAVPRSSNDTSNPSTTSRTAPVTKISPDLAMSSPSLLAALTSAPQSSVAPTAQHVAIPQADAQQDLFFGAATLIDQLALALHLDRTTQRGAGAPEHHQQAVSVCADHDAVVRFDGRVQQQAVLVNDL